MPSVRSNLRDRLQRGETIVAPGAYDPLSARVVQALGFAAVYTGGYMTGAHTSITEPAAGIAGIHIEDQVYPKRASYHKGLEHIVPMPEFVERMTYALKARRDPDFLIIGRTDAFSAVEGSRAELVQRGLTLKELGVDAVMPRGVRAREDLAFFRKEVPGVSLMVIAGADDISVQEYAELGYQIIIYATTPAIVAANALMETYQHLKDTGLLNINAQRVAELRRRVEELISLPEYYEVEAATTEKGNAISAGHH